MYADDLVILAPPVAGLSKLLRICESFGESNDIVFNQKKSASSYFISKMLKAANLPNVYLNGVLVEQDSVKYIGHFLTFVDNVVCLTFVVIFYVVNFTCVVCL